MPRAVHLTPNRISRHHHQLEIVKKPRRRLLVLAGKMQDSHDLPLAQKVVEGLAGRPGIKSKQFDPLLSCIGNDFGGDFQTFLCAGPDD